MILYNVTVNIDDSVRDEWVHWMKTKHIPDVLATGCFIENKMFKLLVEEEQGTSYSMQYFANSLEDVQRYLDDFAPALRAEFNERYKDKFVAFRTLLEKV